MKHPETPEHPIGCKEADRRQNESGRNIEGSDAGIDDDVEVSAQELQSVEASPETEAPRE